MPYNFVSDSFHTGVTAEALRAKIDRKSAISIQRGHFDPQFQVQGVAPHRSFLHIQLGQCMPYNFAADSFHTKKLCSRPSSSEVRFFHENRPFCVFEAPFGGLRGNVRWSSQAHWKARSGLPISVNWIFLRGVTAEALRAIIGSKSAILLQRGSVDPKFQVVGVAPHQPFFFSENSDKLSFVWYKNLDTCFYRFVTIHACDR